MAFQPTHSRSPSISFKGDIAATVNDFNKRAEKHTLVDKSNAIAAFLQTTGSLHLILRPRRCGKTMVLKMFKSFFESGSSVDGERRRKLFTDLPLQIAKSKYFENHFAKYPVIYLDFTIMTNSTDSDGIIRSFSNVISEEYERHSTLGHFEGMTNTRDLTFIDNAINKRLDRDDMIQAFLRLSRILREKCDKEVIVLIDEYDMPVAVAAQELSVEETHRVESFFRGVLSRLLKNNSENVFGALLVGVLRVAKSGYLSGLNNLSVFPSHSDDIRYSTSFMFTEEEVHGLYQHFSRGFPVLISQPLHYEFADLRRWYNGYFSSASARLYNPWSVCRALEDRRLAPYWTQSGSDTYFEKYLFSRTQQFLVNLCALLEDRPIQVDISDDLRYSRVDEMTDDQMWGLLYYAGYITRVSDHNDDLRIPNLELRLVFRKWLQRHLKSIIHSGGFSGTVSQMFRLAINGPTEDFASAFSDVILKNLSSFIIGYGERVYHAFVFGVFLAAAGSAWNVTIDEEAGLGRLDMRIEEINGPRGVIVEFKISETEKALASSAREALQQVEDKQYRAKFPSRTRSLRKYGIAFWKKKCTIVGWSLQREDDGKWTV